MIASVLFIDSKTYFESRLVFALNCHKDPISHKLPQSTYQLTVFQTTFQEHSPHAIPFQFSSKQLTALQDFADSNFRIIKQGNSIFIESSFTNPQSLTRDLISFQRPKSCNRNGSFFSLPHFQPRSSFPSIFARHAFLALPSCSWAPSSIWCNDTAPLPSGSRPLAPFVGPMHYVARPVHACVHRSARRDAGHANCTLVNTRADALVHAMTRFHGVRNTDIVPGSPLRIDAYRRASMFPPAL